MKKVGSYEAKTHLPRLLNEVAETGESYLITRNDKPLARLVPAEHAARRDVNDVVADILALRPRRDCSDIGWKEVKEAASEGRR